jgi:outer membrane receptor protein involved in Fe transport
MSALSPRYLAAVAVLLCAVLFVTGAGADDLADEADLQFNLGADRYEAGDYKGALQHFLISNRLVRNRNVLFNIARTYEQLKRAPDAYRYYLQALEGETDPTSRKRVEDAVSRITPLVAILQVETTPKGATVYLDRKDLGPRGDTPRTIGLPAGKHKVLVELEGYKPAETPQPVEVKIGKKVRVHLALEPILGTLVVEGEPDAEVRLDAEDAPVLCKVPCRAPAPPGRHIVFFSKPGFLGSESVVVVPPNEEVSVRARLVTQRGSLVVSSDVRDALITVDGAPMGFTPAVLNVPVGKHVVSVSQTGFRPIEKHIEITAKGQVRVDVQLAPFEEVVAASRVSEAVEDAPASVTIISYQELKGMGYPTIAEAVRGIRGIYLSDDRSYQTIGVRGFSRPGDYGNRILILLDGMPMNDNYIWSSYVGFDGRVDIDDIERIEVVRGPGSVLYGTSAFFGVINLVTRSRNQPTHGEVSASAVQNAGRARATAVVRFTDDAGMWLTVSGLRSPGTDHYFPELATDPRDPNAELDANGRPIDGQARGLDGFDAGMVTGRAWYKSLTAQWFYNFRNKTLPTAAYETIFNDPRTRFNDKRGLVEARFEPKVSESVQLLSRGHLNMYDFDGALAYPAPDGLNRDTYRGRWGGLEQRIVYSPSSVLRATLGGEVIRHFQTLQLGDGDAGPLVFDDAGNPGRNDPFVVAAGYALADVTPHERVKISAGARYDYYSSLDEQSLISALNPRLAVVLKPYDRGNLKLMGGKAFRAPSVYELFYTAATQIRPTGLDPEQIVSTEAEFTHRFSPVVAATVAAYANYVSELIELRDLPDGRVQYTNSNAPVLVLGSEYELRREWRGGWMLAGTYSLQRVRYLEDPTLRGVPNSPTHLASMKGAVPIIGRSLMGMTRISVEGPRPDRNFQGTDPPQGTTDTGVIWDLVFSGEAEKLGIRYAVGAYNIAGWRYDTVPSSEFRQRTIVQNGRTVLATVSASF